MFGKKNTKSKSQTRIKSGYYTYPEGKRATPPPEPLIDVQPAEKQETSSEPAPKNKRAAIGTIAAGIGTTLVGIPLLLIPGPGLVTIGAGIALITKGAKDLKNK